MKMRIGKAGGKDTETESKSTSWRQGFHSGKWLTGELSGTELNPTHELNEARQYFQ